MLWNYVCRQLVSESSWCLFKNKTKQNRFLDSPENPLDQNIFSGTRVCVLKEFQGDPNVHENQTFLLLLLSWFWTRNQKEGLTAEKVVKDVLLLKTGIPFRKGSRRCLPMLLTWENVKPIKAFYHDVLETLGTNKSP